MQKIKTIHINYAKNKNLGIFYSPVEYFSKECIRALYFNRDLIRYFDEFVSSNRHNCYKSGNRSELILNIFSHNMRNAA